MAIIRKIPWTRYPEHPVVNKGYWQGQNLLAFWPLVGGEATGKKDLAGHQDLSFDSNVSTQPVIAANRGADVLGWRWSADGKYLRITDNNEGFDDLFFTGGFDADSDVTITLKVRGDFAGQRNYILGDFSSGSSDHFLYLRTETDDTWSFAIVLDNGSNHELNVGTYAQDTVYSLALTFSFGAVKEAKLYVDGVQTGPTEALSDATGFDAAKGFQSCIGNFKGSSTTSTSSWLGDIWDVRVYRGVLNPAQILEIHNDPWQIFEPRTQIIPVEVAAAPTPPDAFGTFQRKVPWTHQPPAGTPVSGPFTDGLIYINSFADIEAPDVLQKLAPTIVDFSENQSSDARYGSKKSLSTTGSASDYYNTHYAPITNDDPEMSVVALVKTGFNGTIVCQRNGTASQWWQFNISGSNNAVAFYMGVDPGVLYADTLVQDDEWHLIHASVRGGEQRGFLDGVFLASDTTAWNQTGSTAPDISVGMRWSDSPPGTGDPLPSDIALVAVWHNRFLSDAEHAALGANPWQIFQPHVVNIPVAAIAAGGGEHTATGAPSIILPTAGGVAEVVNTATGSPSILLVTAAGVAEVANTATGAPSVFLPTASGAAEVVNTATGAPSIILPTAAGVAEILNTATGAPSILLPTSAGTAGIDRNATGAPSVFLPTAAGAAEVVNTATGSPSILLVTAAGTADADASPGETADGAPSVFLPTAAGTSEIIKTATGAPSVFLPTAAGAAGIDRSATGAPSILLPTAAGVAEVANTATGAPTLLLPTAAGAAGIDRNATGAPSILLPTAAGTSEIIKTADGSPSVFLPTAAGASEIIKTATGTPVIILPTAAGAAHPCSQILPPTAIEAIVGLSGDVTDIDEPVNSPDGNWLLLAA